MNKIFFILAVTVLSSCNYSRMKKPLDLDPAAQKITSPDQITFKMVNESVIQPMCLSCHSEAGGNRGGLNLESFDNVFKNSHAIRLEVAGGTMPPRQKLSDQHIKLVTDWIDAGAHENGKANGGGNNPPAPTPAPEPNPTPVEPPPVLPPAPTPTPVEPPPVLPPSPTPTPVEPPPVVPTPVMPPAPVEPPPILPPATPAPVEPPPVVPPVPQPPAGPTFNEVMNNVIKTNCFQCHTAAAGNRGGLNLETYQNIFDNRHSIKFEVENGTMPTRRGTPLTAAQKQMLLTWIENGANP